KQIDRAFAVDALRAFADGHLALVLVRQFDKRPDGPQVQAMRTGNRDGAPMGVVGHWSFVVPACGLAEGRTDSLSRKRATNPRVHRSAVPRSRCGRGRCGAL